MSKKVLEVAGEGGGITLFESNNCFSFSSNNTASLDMLDEEDQAEIRALLASKTSLVYLNFEEVFVELMTKYPVFALYPLHLDNEYREIVKKHFEIASLSERYAHECVPQLNNWQSFLDGKSMD